MSESKLSFRQKILPKKSLLPEQNLVITEEAKFLRFNFDKAVELRKVLLTNEGKEFLIIDRESIEGPDNLGLFYFTDKGVRLGFSAYNTFNTKSINRNLKVHKPSIGNKVGKYMLIGGLLIFASSAISDSEGISVLGFVLMFFSLPLIFNKE